jgi:hypothetical protein
MQRPCIRAVAVMKARYCHKILLQFFRMTKRGGVDYSKWDRFEDSEEEEEEEQDTMKPRVTKLSSPSQIKTTSDGKILVLPSNTTSTKATSQTNQHTLIPTTKKLHLLGSKMDKWIRQGGYISSWDLYWSQDRKVVTLRWKLPVTPRLTDITVSWEGHIYAYNDRCHAVGSDNTASFFIRGAENILLFHGTLPYPIHYPEHETELDWEIDRHPEKDDPYVVLALFKAVPMDGMIWNWNRPLTQVLEESSSSPQNLKFKSAWEEAHTTFREKMANR